MGIEDTARRRIGPATRALAAAVGPPRRRLPTLQEAFDDEERSTDSEIENVLGVIESIPPMAPAPEPRALPPEREESGMQPRTQEPPPRDEDAIGAIRDDHAVALRKRQLIVVTGVCALGALVLALAAVLHVVRGLAAPQRPPATQEAAPQSQTASHPPPSKRP